MSRIAACPKCQKQFTLPELAGPATLACPFCQALISLNVKPTTNPVAQMVPSAKLKAFAAVADDDDEDDDDEDEPVRSKRRKDRGLMKAAPASQGKKIAIVVSILLLTTLCIVGVFWSVLSDGKKPVNQNVINAMRREQQQNNDGLDSLEVAEATGSEKFEIPDKALIQSDYYQSHIPVTKLPGLDTHSIKEGNESLSAGVLKRVKQCTVYIETERDQGGGTGSGFFACEKGLVVTNAHVIDMLEEGREKPKSVRVYTNHGAKDQKDYKVIDFKVDRKHDLAILRLPNSYKDEYPEPMALASSLTAHETQKMFSLGFPFGNSAGKEVTVTPIAVSSLRYEEGRIKLVQFGGGSLNPGNSGGPIVDAAGRVVAVAVSIFTGRNGDGSVTNTGISMGVPADEVSALFFGRPDRFELFPPVRKGNVLHLPVVFRLSDHSSRNASPKVRVFTGDEKKPPENPAPGEEPLELKAGETRQLYSGSLALPELEDGKVYWLQPQLTFGENQTNWLEPFSFIPGKILESKELPASASAGASLGEMKLKQRYQYVMNSSRGPVSVRLDYEGGITGGTQAIKDLRLGARADDRPLPHQALQRLWANRVNEEDAPSVSTKLTSLLKMNLNRWHDIAQLDVPKDAIDVGKTWKVTKRPVTLDYLFGSDLDQSCNLSCEYLGCYQQGNRLIGVLRIQGTLSEADNADPKYGKCSGLALVDSDNRQLLDLMLRCDVRKRTTGYNILGGAASIDGVMQLRLQRPGSS